MWAADGQAAQEAGWFDSEIVPVTMPDTSGALGGWGELPTAGLSLLVYGLEGLQCHEMDSPSFWNPATGGKSAARPAGGQRRRPGLPGPSEGLGSPYAYGEAGEAKAVTASDRRTGTRPRR